MNKKRLVSAMFLLVFLLLLEAVCKSTGDGGPQMTGKPKPVAETEMSSESTVKNADASGSAEVPAKDEDEDYYDEIVAAIDGLLSNGTGDFFEHYPVDESFFLWLETHCGAGTVSNIAKKVERHNTNSNLWYQMTGSTMHVLWLEYCKAFAYQTHRLDNVTWKDAAKDGQVTIDFVGDINFDPTWHVMKYAQKKGGIRACISEELLEELKSADITMVNNEFCYTNETQSQEGKAYCFKVAPKQVDLLDEFGTDIVSLANNHTCDYGEQGLLDTIDTLKAKGIVSSGAGRNLAEAGEVKYFVSGGRKLAFVSATEIERFYHYTKKAGESTPGVLKTQQEEAVSAAIQEARANSDYVILFVHWGAEGKNRQDERQRALAKQYAAAGVDAIIGSHPHRLQGVEFVGDVPVVYSLGNFWFSTGTLYATIAQLEINMAGSLKLRLIPCVQQQKETRLLVDEEERKGFYRYVADMSAGIQINEDGVFGKWNESEAVDMLPAYRSGRQYGMHFDDADLELRPIDVVGNLQ